MEADKIYLIYAKYVNDVVDSPVVSSPSYMLDAFDIRFLATHQFCNVTRVNEISGFGKMDLFYHVLHYEFEYLENAALIIVVGFNIETFNDYFLNVPTSVPQFRFMKKLCENHLKYVRAYNYVKSKYISSYTHEDVVKHLVDSVNNVIIYHSQIDDHQDILTCNLYPYQKRNIKKMIDIENNPKTMTVQLCGELNLGKVKYCDDGLVPLGESNFITFNSGALVDEVGLGKTIQIIMLSILNPLVGYQPPTLASSASSSSSAPPLPTLFNSKATLIICPNNVCNQWFDEIEQMIKKTHGLKVYKLFTKIHHDKISYSQMFDADFVITTFNFLSNKSYQGVHNVGCGDVTDFATTAVNINIINWHRIAIDEFHELADKPKIIDVVQGLNSKFKWIVTGTPFAHSLNFEKIIQFTSVRNATMSSSNILKNNEIIEHLNTSFFIRNTKESIKNECVVPSIKETNIFLDFSEIERVVYDSYKANSEVDEYNETLVQLCCHPKIADKFNKLIGKCETLDEIKHMMLIYYETDVIELTEKLNQKKQQLATFKHDIKMKIFDLQKYQLSTIGYSSEINLSPPPNTRLFNEINKFIVICDETQPKIIELLSQCGSIDSQVLHTLKVKHDSCERELIKLSKELSGKQSSLEYYKRFLDRIKDIRSKSITHSSSSSSVDASSSSSTSSSNDNDDDDYHKCVICLENVPDYQLVFTICGHMFCRACITSYLNIKKNCPTCRGALEPSQIYAVRGVNDNGDNELGAKLTALITFLKNCDKHVIIFSQWDNMLKLLGSTLSKNGIKNVFCNGNVMHRSKILREFNNTDNTKVIMLSSKNSASGTNLTKAKVIILFDIVNGTTEQIKSIENQAIGRSHRISQKDQVEVIRYIIKDTVEELIYNKCYKDAHILS